MKKAIIILLAVMVMVSSVSLAEDLSSLSDAELLLMYKRSSLELESRGIDPGALYPGDAFSGDDLWTKGMADSLELFFGFWNASGIPDMLAVCSPGWKDSREDPEADLLTILGDRIPTDFEIVAVSREISDNIRLVSLIAGMDKNDGNGPADYLLRISMTREADGCWYTDPGSLQTFEYTADGPTAVSADASAEETPEAAEYTVLYYCPEGGQYYHADRNCKTVDEKYLPLEGHFTYGELENEAFKDLQPCIVCGAPLRREN